MCGNEQFSDGTCHFLYLELGSKPMLHLRGVAESLCLRITSHHHIIVLLRYKENSFTFYDGFGKSALIWIFKPSNLAEGFHLRDGCCGKKVLLFMAKRN